MSDFIRNFAVGIFFMDFINAYRFVTAFQSAV